MSACIAHQSLNADDVTSAIDIGIVRDHSIGVELCVIVTLSVASNICGSYKNTAHIRLFVIYRNSFSFFPIHLAFAALWL